MEDKIKMLKVDESLHMKLKRMVLQDSSKETTLEQLVHNLINEGIEARRKEQINEDRL